ncbi:hypothetical protein [Afipia birgiae]|uniref:hypothetical protein n=1 Tax=Afipia birgiae TaxID=151414 RepID=UPI0002FA0B3E|nr:hypothetical protein [Afipia birgiae]MBX9820050.1 hypothetical protein [Afipia birgiae]
MFVPALVFAVANIPVFANHFYKRRGRYEKIDGLPKPYKVGCWDRASVDAWRTRNHPARPPIAANDATPPIMPGTVEQWTDYLHRHYAKVGA